WRASTPSTCNSRHIEATSIKSGTFSSSSGWSLKRHAAISGRAAFLAPLISIVPRSGTPPLIRRRSIAFSRKDRSDQLTPTWLTGGNRLRPADDRQIYEIPDEFSIKTLGRTQRVAVTLLRPGGRSGSRPRASASAAASG